MSKNKVGRNDPCPCGSGKKFKKCCIARTATSGDAPPGRSTESDEPGMAGSWEGGSALGDLAFGMTDGMPEAALNLSAYVIAKIAEDPRSAGDNAALRTFIKERSRRGWSIKKVGAMTTAAIEEQLIAYGVRHTRDRFLRLAEGRTSAWSISHTWIAEDGVACSGKAGELEDFLGLAACELWKRLLTERPSIEMLDDWMQDGYVLIGERKWPEACDVWWRVWSGIRSQVLSPEMTRMHAADAVFCGSQSIQASTEKGRI